MSEWQFLLDENVDPKTATYLQKEEAHAEHVRDALWQGADDEDDVLPYAREHDLDVVTSDVKDFGGLPAAAHTGIVLLYDASLPRSVGSLRWMTPTRVVMRSRDAERER